jgi:hypothetical protein
MSQSQNINVMAEFVKAGITNKQIGNHESDLYVEVNEISKNVVKEHGLQPNSRFNSNIDGKPNYEFAFQYTPAWDKKIQPNATQTVAKGLPKICYAVHPETKEAVLIVRGETEPRPAPYIDDVQHYNKKLGISDIQQQCMLAGITKGWNSPESDPKVVTESMEMLSYIKTIFPEFTPDNKKDLEFVISPKNKDDVYELLLLHPVPDYPILPKNSYSITRENRIPPSGRTGLSDDFVQKKALMLISINETIQAHYVEIYKQSGLVYKDSLQNPEQKFYATPSEVMAEAHKYLKAQAIKINPELDKQQNKSIGR